MSGRPLANILVIDNDEGMQRALRTRLESLGYACLTASNGTQGLSTFDPKSVDLVITDLNMPAMNGLGVIEQVRRRSDVPVIVITGFPGEYAGAMMKHRDVTVLAKPFDSHTLIDLVTAELAMHSDRMAG